MLAGLGLAGLGLDWAACVFFFFFFFFFSSSSPSCSYSGWTIIG